MKKILFIALAVAGFSQFSYAQEAARMTPAPTPQQNDKATKEKMAKMKAESAPDPAKTTVKVSATDPNVANYKKAGVDDKTISEIVSRTAELDKQKASIAGNSQLTDEQKKNGLTNIEAEKAAVLRKSMGEASYKKYIAIAPPVTKPAKATITKPAAKATN